MDNLLPQPRKKHDLTQLEAQLFEALVSDGSFDVLVQKASDFMGCPIIVIDRTFRVLANSRIEDITDVLWAQHVRKRFCSIDFIVSFNLLPSVIEGKNAEGTFLVPCRYSTFPKLVCKLQSGGKDLGYLFCLCQAPAEPSDFPALDLVAKMLSYRWKRSLNTNLEQAKEDILIDLLSGSYIDDENTKERLRFSNLTFPEHMYLLAINLSPNSPDRKFLSSFFDYSRHHFDQDMFVYYQDYIVVFLADIRLNSIIDALSEKLPGGMISVGISRMISRLSDCPRAFEEAKSALMLGYYAHPNKNIHFFQDVIFYTLIQDLDPETAIEQFAHPVLRQLYCYDLKNLSELNKTLYIFLENDGSLQKTAQEMYLHRNTVSFRINKIAEILGNSVDMRDSELRRQLLLSYRIIHFLKRKQKGVQSEELNEKSTA